MASLITNAKTKREFFSLLNKTAVFVIIQTARKPPQSKKVAAVTIRGKSFWPSALAVWKLRNTIQKLLQEKKQFSLFEIERTARKTGQK
jgi:hypothetical protein